jgi:hypothetical protein
MKYNVMTVLSDNYLVFGKLFINSIFENIDNNNINKILIVDTGLTEKTKQYMLDFPKVEIIPTLDMQASTKIHDKAWESKTYSKSTYLLDYIKGAEPFYPTILFDSDVIFYRDFFDILNSKAHKDSDVIACERNQIGRAPGHVATSTHIGCFICIKSRKAIPFVEYWISTLTESLNNGVPSGILAKESPALSKAIKEFDSNIKITNIDERVIANIETKIEDGFDDYRVYHLKSDYMYLTVKARVRQPRALPYLEKYLGK